VARFTAFLRAVMPGLAGASRMPYRRFLTYNAAGALAWSVGVTLLGYFAGHSYAAAERALGRGSAILAVILTAGGLLLWHRHRRRRTDAPDDDRANASPSG
jgi:membrane protein DedA with SNARE-associated domain